MPRALSHGALLGLTLGFVVLGQLGAHLVPAVQFAAYLGLAALVGGGLAWPVHLAAGAPLLAGLYGVITSGFAIPPRALRAS